MTEEQESPDHATDKLFRKLDADAIRNCLNRNNLISEVHYTEETDSTNTLARRINKNNILVITEYQTNGRGRFGRNWQSAKAKNLLFTIKQKSPLEAVKLHYLNFYYPYIVYVTIRDFITENNTDATGLKIKWPNDVIYENKKISGILIETSQPDNITFTGIGININQVFHGNTSCISLKQILDKKDDIDRTDFLIKLIKNFNLNLNLLEDRNLKILFNLWKKSTDMIGKEILLNHLGAQHHSIVVDLLENGGIKLIISGKEKIFYSSEITISLQTLH